MVPDSMEEEIDWVDETKAVPVTLPPHCARSRPSAMLWSSSCSCSGLIAESAPSRTDVRSSSAPPRARSRVYRALCHQRSSVPRSARLFHQTELWERSLSPATASAAVKP